MITGVRLTQLGNGEPLLGTAWSYQNLSGIEAVEKRLEDLFFNAQNLGFNFIIDTIKPQLDVNGNLHLNNNGFYGDEWPFERRIELYQKYLVGTKLELLAEVEFPTNITDDNIVKYANYFIDLVDNYPWIKYWQVMVNPEHQDRNGEYKCRPESYVEFMKYVYPNLKIKHIDIKLGGPGIYQALIDYVNFKPDNWLSIAMGEKYRSGDPLFEVVGDKGFLLYVDFFSIQAKQNTEGLKYEIFSDIIATLNTAIKQKLNKTLPIYSISQGWKASSYDQNSLNEQGYYELREFLNCVRNGIIPFKTQLVDEFAGPMIDDSKLDYGLLYYYLGVNGQKPAFKEYYFLLKNLKDFNTVTATNIVIDSNPNVEILTLINNNQDMTATIIWPKELSSETIVLQPHYARQYLLPDGTQNGITNPTQIVLDKNHFIIIYQTINKTVIDIEQLESLIERKLNHTEETLSNLIELLPTSYNKEVKDVNYYKLLRAFALEMADAKIEIEELRDNLYLDSAHDDSIYNNFGVLVNLAKRPEWDYEKYRRLVKGVTQSLLEGPTPNSIIDAIKLFTSFDVNIYELYKAHMHIDKSILENVNPQFAFVIEIEKPVDVNADQDQIFRDTNYVINIIKPAHTIHLIIITLAGKENYRDAYKAKYGIELEKSDVYEQHVEQSYKEGTFGWKHFDYEGQFLNNDSLTNSGLFIGPRYVLYDSTNSHLQSTSTDEYGEVSEIIHSILDYHVYDEYKGAEEERHIEFEQHLEENKFGFDNYGLIRYNIRTLNEHRLAPGRKLNDEEFYHLQQFLEDKYVFRNTLQSLRFNKPHIVGIHGLGNKFSVNPDKAVKFDFDLKEHSFKKKVTKLSDGKVIEISRLYEKHAEELELKEKTKKIEDPIITEIGTDLKEIKDLKQTKEVANAELGLKENIDDVQEDYDINIDGSLFEQIPGYLEDITTVSYAKYFEKYDVEKRIRVKNEPDLELKENKYTPVDDSYSHAGNINTEEWYRQLILGEEIYHVHKKITQILGDDHEKIYLPPRDLYTRGYEGFESLTRVFVNGILQPSFNYYEIPSSLDPTKAIGIQFKDGIVFMGDIVNILYLKDREVIFGAFPIKEESPTEVIFGVNEDTWRVVENVDDYLIVNYEHSDKFKKVEEYLDTIIIRIDNNCEEYDGIHDVSTFEGGEYKDTSLWNLTVNREHRMTLNLVPLNGGVMFGTLQEVTTMDMTTFEKVESLKDELVGSIHTTHFNDEVPQVKGDYEFSSGFHEEDIGSKLAPIDSMPEIGMMPNEHYIPQCDFVEISKQSSNHYESYEIKEERPYQDYITGTYIDSINIQKIKERVIEHGAEVYEKLEYVAHDGFTIDLTPYNIEKYTFKHSDMGGELNIPYADKINLDIKEVSSLGYEVKDKIKPVKENKHSASLLNYSDLFNTINIEDDGEIELIAERKEAHLLQQNLNRAFKFGMKFNEAKFPSRPVLDYENYGVEYGEHIETNKKLSNLIKLDYDMKEQKYVIKNAESLTEYNKLYCDKYNRVTSDFLDIRKVEDFNQETYRPKNTQCDAELFRVTASGKKQTIKIFSA